MLAAEVRRPGRRKRPAGAGSSPSAPCGHDVPVVVVVVFVFATVISLVGAAVWIGLLIWAAKADGREQQHEQDKKRGDSDR